MDTAPRTHGEEKARRMRVMTRHATVAAFVRGFAPAIDEDHVLVSMGAAAPVDSIWQFSICLQDGTAVFEGVGRLVEMRPGRDAQGRVTARLALVWLDPESTAMHEALLRARPAPDLARGTGGPFRPSSLPLPPPPLRGYGDDGDDDDDGLSATTQLYGRQHGPLPVIVTAPAAPAAPAPAVAAPASAEASEPASAAAPCEPEAPRPARVRTVWLVALALLVAAAAATAFGVIAFWE